MDNNYFGAAMPPSGTCAHDKARTFAILLIIIQVRAAAKHTLPLLPLLPSFSSFPSVSEQNGGPKKALNPQIRGTEGM